MPLPIYFVAQPGARVDTLSAPELGDVVHRLASAEDLGVLGDLEPGIVLVDRDSVDEAQLLRLTGLVAAAGAPWLLAVIEGQDDPTVRTLGFGLPNSSEEVASFSREAADNPGVLMDLQRALVEVAKVRHDLNNPLTAALAEVQLLLFDATDEELRESLEVIQSQLRRMRDLVTSTSHLRPPRV
jgi:signal transduction histidine kinase